MIDPARPAEAQGTEVVAPGDLAPTLARPADGRTPLNSGWLEPRLAPPRAPGELGRLGRFRVLKKLGKGGMGAVYLGYDEALERAVALKVMLPVQAAAPAARERFLREARSAAKIKSDHVVTIFDVGDEDGNPFIAMEHLSGCSLGVYLNAHGELPPEQALRVGRETALGLAAAHDLGLVHRDIKPDNIWLEAPHGRVKILDFGLARVATDDAHLTGSGAVVGTPTYMSPEQGRGLPVDHRTDLFSLGVVLYRLCTGALPFDGPSTMAVLTSLAVDTPADPRALNPQLPEAVAAVILKLLAKNPAERFQTARDAADALGAVERSVFGPAVVPVAMRVEPQGAADVWAGIATECDAPTATPVVSPSTGSAVARRGAAPAGGVRWRAVLVPAAALLVAGALLAGLLNRLSKGTLAVESDDPDVEVIVKRDGAVVRDRTRDREFVLRAGAYTVEVAGRSGLSVTPDRVDVAERATARVRVAPVPPRAAGPAAPKVAGPVPPDRRAAEYVIGLGGSVVTSDSEREVGRAADLPKGPFTLRSISSGNINITDAGLEVFKDCTELTGLDLNNSPATDAGLAHFKGCKKLTHLNLSGAQVTDAGLAHFKDCPDLAQINLGELPITDAGLAHFRDRPNLSRVTLTRTAVTDAGLAHLAGCAGLIELSLAGTRATDAGLVHARRWTNLRLLFLDGTAVTDAGLEHLKGCTRLVDLNLSGTQVTDAGLAHLRDCKSFRMLNLRGTQVTDAAVGPLKECKGLMALDVVATKVTARALAGLADAVPGCRIDHAGGTIEPRK